MNNWLLIQGVTAQQYLDAWDHGKMDIPDGSNSAGSDEVKRWLASNREGLDVRYNEKSGLVGVFFEDILMAQHSDMNGLPSEGRTTIMNIYDRMRGALEEGAVYNLQNWGQPLRNGMDAGKLEAYIDAQYAPSDDRWDIGSDGASVYLPISEELEVLEFVSIKSEPIKVEEVLIERGKVAETKTEPVGVPASDGRGYKGPAFGANRTGRTAPR